MNINNITTDNVKANAIGSNAQLANKYQDNQEKTDAKKATATTSMKKSDKLELSETARKLEPIRQKIEDGYYDNIDIIKSVAEKINQDLRAEEK